MELNDAEAQLLAMVHTMEVRPWDWESGQPALSTVDVLERHGRLLFEGGVLDWSSAYESLVGRGLLGFDGDAFAVTPEGRPTARDVARGFASSLFGPKLAAIATSSAYQAMCRQTLDLAVGQYSPLDRVQLEALLDGLKLTPGSRVLDFGCGNGGVAQSVAERTGAHVTGLDVAESAIEVARRRQPTQQGLVAIIHKQFQ